MRNKTSIVGAALALVLLSACGTLPAERDEPSSYRRSLDTEMIAVVESTATRTGTEVYWVNPPRKPKKD